MFCESDDLSVEFAGLAFRNPFLLASGPPTRTGDMIARAFEQGWAGAVTKTLKSPSLRRTWLAREPQPMVAGVEFRGRRIGMQNIATSGSYLEMEQWQSEIAQVKSRFPDRVILGSVAATMDQSDWQWLARGLLDAGADGIELDVSCSHASAQQVGGQMVGQIPDLVSQVIRWVREVCDEPIVVKLPAFVIDFSAMVQACASAGAQGVSGINTLPCLAGIDLSTSKPLLSVGGRSAYGGLSGPAIKPVALRAVSLMAQSDTLPVSGIGGILSWQDAAEFLLLGAATVQLCTAVMWQGYGIIHQLVTGISGYLVEMQWNHISQMIGQAQDRVAASIAQLDIGSGVVAAIVPDRCKNCGSCVVACRDGAYQAIVQGETQPVIQPERCDGCGLCRIVCPSHAIVLTERSAPGRTGAQAPAQSPTDWR